MLDKDIEPHSTGIYKFGSVVFQPSERRVTKNGTPVYLNAKLSDLLEFFVTNQGKLLTKDEILARVWEGAETYESSLTTHISMLRQALEQSKESLYIETVPKKGYRFVAKVEALPEEAGTPADIGIPLQGDRSSLWSIRVLVSTILLVAAITMAVWYLRAPQTPAHVRLYRDAIEAERLGNDNLALVKLQEALRLQPAFSEANLRAAWICYEDNDNETASKYVNAVLNQKENVTNSVQLQADALQLLLTSNQEGAFNKLKAAADAQPADPYTLSELAGQAINLGLFDEADKALQRCKLADPDNPFCTFQAITLRVYQDRFPEALSEYQRAETGGMSYPWLHEPAGYAKLAQGDCDGASKQFRALEEAGRKLASNVHFRASQEGIAAVALYQGKLQLARQQIRDALKTSISNFDQASYYISLAEMDALHSQATDAVKEAKEAVTLSPDTPEIWISAVRVLAMTNKFDEASALLAKHEGESGIVGMEYPAAEHLIRGFRSKSEHKWDAAIADLEDSYGLDREPITAYYLASSQMSVSRWSDAKVTLDELLQSKGRMLMESPASLIPLSQLSLATCYERLGDRTQAEQVREAVNTLWKDADPKLLVP